MLELALIAAFFGARSLLFGRHGFPRVPKGRWRPMQVWLADTVVLGLFAGCFDWTFLHSAWLERRENWKYVFCAANIVWPLPLMGAILNFFRQEAEVPEKGKEERRPATSERED